MSLEQVQKDKKRALRPYEDQPVGCPPDPDSSTMTEEERATRRGTVGKLRELVEEAKEGDTGPLPEIREILRESPELAWRIMDYGRLAEWHFVERMTGEEDLGSKEVLTNQLAAMREEVAGENPSPLERLLAERVVATWLQVQLFEGLYAASLYHSTNLNQANYYQKRMDRVHRNHLSAIRTLAQVRKLGPAVQINIAKKQLNTVG